MMNVDKVVTKFIVIRDRIDDVKKRHKEELLPYQEKADTLEAKLLTHLHKTKSDSIKTKGGTVYRTKRNSDVVSDWDVFLKFVRKNKYWHMLFKRVSGTSVSEHIENNKGKLPPGVSRTTDASINIRRK